MSRCRICDKPSMVMDRQYSGKVPFKPHNKSKSFICGMCVAHGRWPEIKGPVDAGFDLKGWRRLNKLTQAQAAKILQTKREAISMVERGHRLMPKSWKSKLLQTDTKKKLRIHPSYNVTRGYLDLKWVKM